MLVLHASAVSVGGMSFDIAESVIAHGTGDNDANNGNDTDKDDDKRRRHPVVAAQTRRVCKASFTYVITRGPYGKKRLCLKLDEPSEE